MALNSQDPLGCVAVSGKRLGDVTEGAPGATGLGDALCQGLSHSKLHLLGVASSRSTSQVGWGALRW